MCGRPRSACSDPEKVFYPQRAVCYATMELEAAKSKYQRMHESEPWHDGRFGNWSAKQTDESPIHFQAGVTIFVAEVDLQPDDDFLDDSSD